MSVQATAQQQVPPAPDAGPAAAPAAGQTPTAPTAPAPAAAPMFPKVDPANFTATTPTKETIEGFLTSNWGYDQSRAWEIWSVMKTPIDGVSRVIVLVGDKTGKQKVQPLMFYVMPGGKFIITGDEVIPFGEHPFAERRTALQQKADGPSRGAASKDLELVEFADFQCPHCKEAQANMDKLATDFPKAHIVFQNSPIASIHPQSVKAAEYGACVAKLGGNTAFFQYAAAVFEGQDGLNTADGATLTINSAVTKAGLDPAKVATCAALPATKAAVEASVQLSKDMMINSVPTLMINGRPVPANAPYDTLKQIIEYQAKLDGVAAH